MLSFQGSLVRKTNDRQIYGIWFNGNVNVCKIKCVLKLHYVRLWKVFLHHYSQEEEIS